jgi:hypothetical protein
MWMKYGSTVLLLRRAVILLLPAAITTTITSFTVVQAFLDPPPNQQHQPPLSSPLGNSFSIQLALTPLRTIASDSRDNLVQQHPHDSSSSCCEQQQFLVPGRKELPVLYTNDPHQVSSWLNEYIPTDGTNCFVGFDIEVRKTTTSKRLYR